MPTTSANPAATYVEFYATAYRSDHRHPLNLALHMLGTIAGLGLFIAVAAGLFSPWWALAFPIVHAVPGLIGHRMFDRDAQVGDLRVTRRDYPLWWFVRANHRMTLDVLIGRWNLGSRA